VGSGKLFEISVQRRGSWFCYEISVRRRGSWFVTTPRDFELPRANADTRGHYADRARVHIARAEISWETPLRKPLETSRARFPRNPGRGATASEVVPASCPRVSASKPRVQPRGVV